MQPEVLKTSKPLIYSGLLQVVQSCSELFIRGYLPMQKRSMASRITPSSMLTLHVIQGSNMPKTTTWSSRLWPSIMLTGKLCMVLSDTKKSRASKMGSSESILNPPSISAFPIDKRRTIRNNKLRLIPALFSIIIR